MLIFNQINSLKKFLETGHSKGNNMLISLYKPSVLLITTNVLKVKFDLKERTIFYEISYFNQSNVY